MATVSGAPPSTDRPFFRYDLETVQVVEGQERYVDVADPQTGTRFRFYEVEYAVACGMDGRRDLAGLSAWAKDELGLDTDPDELRGVVDTLAELGYLGAPAVAVEAPAERLGRQEKPTAPGGAVETPAPRAAAPTDPVPASLAEGDVPLGLAGKSPLEREQPEPLPETPDIELGFAGAPAESADEPAAVGGAADIELGFAGASTRSETEPSGPPERMERMSTNLGDHMDVDTEDVKEAVRQSRVMSAVTPEEIELEADEPDDLLDTHQRETVRMPQSDAKALAAEAAARAAARTDDGTEAATEPGKKKAAIVKKAEVAPAESAAKAKAKAKADDKAKAKAKADDKAKAKAKTDDKAKGKADGEAEAARAPATAAVEPERRERRSAASVVLWGILLGVVAAGAWYYYTEFVAEREPAPPVQPQVPAEAQVAPKPAPLPRAVLAAGEAPSADATAPQAGKVAWIATAGTEVAEGDVVAKLAGSERFERALAEDQASRDRYQSRLDAATARGNKRQMAQHQADVDRKTRDMAKVQEKLDAFLIAAPVAGVVEPVVEVGFQVDTGAPVVRVTGEAGPTAEFSVPTGDYAEGDEVEVAAADDPGLTATCAVTGTAPGKIQVECPVDSGLGDGTAVVLPAQD